MTKALDITPAPGKPRLLLGAFDIDSVGYSPQEFFITGSASSYAPHGELGSDGRWDVTPSRTAEYTTRIVALTPVEPAKFNGTVLVEWLNVSGGIDAPAVWMMAHREILRAGYAYVAVSAQKVGVDGGASLLGIDMSLKTQDPTRYASLNHPGDAFAFDIFSQAGQIVRTESDSVLGGLSPRHVIGVGESQSAMFLTTYINAVDPHARVYDGFLVHSRFGPAAPLDGSSLFEERESARGWQEVVKFRPDLRVPLITVITETDLFGHVPLGYYLARQPDNELLRVWEIPGAAHADNYTIRVAPIDSGFAPIADLVAAYAPTNMLMGQRLSRNINFAPQHHYVVQASMAALDRWVRTDEPAPSAAPIKVDESEPLRLLLDANGLAEGGIRSPWVDVPIARTSGVTTDESLMAAIFGSGETFDTATLRRLYPGGATEYVDRFTDALDASIRSGFILPADRAEILELAAATYPDGQP